ncbi:PAS domain S-box-containing protein [Geothermobacter ehrlichii]|uniref:histidine kinase n=1 Tax=Geothermobacter ehrlichii TaxID=213224 RepID=A0A5D3WR07_9BACT|nr:PAS domain-containing protein [Geothermobacter ehrlichii]TYP00230.1 PAS domain S-box-containing protein [Geothermobacter ehrlichii]
MPGSSLSELFESLPVPAWIEDFSAVRKRIDQLRQNDIQDWSLFFLQHPDIVRECAGLVRILDVNGKALELYGAKNKQELLTNQERVFTDHSFRIFSEELAALAEGSTEFSTRVQHRTLQGEAIYIDLRASIPTGYHDSWERVIVLTLDVTRETLAEEGLRKNREHLGSFYRNTPIAYQSLDSRGCFLDVNPAFERMLGYSRDELIGKPVADLLTEESRQKLQQLFQAFLMSDQVEKGEITMLDKNGRPLDIMVEGRLERDPETGRLRTHCLLHNITEKKRRESELQRQKKSYRQLFDQFQILFDGIPDPLILITPDLEISWVNKGAVKETGKSLDVLLGRLCEELHRECNLPCDAAMVRSCLETGKPATSLVGTPDERSWGLRAFPVMNDQGQVIQVMIIAHDVTEKIRLQAETMRTGQLAALGELAAGVAHEINNPINGIINYAQILINKARRQGERNEIAERILKEGDRIATIVGNLLSFSRDKIEEKRPVRLQDILDEAMTLCEARLRKDGIHLEIDIPPDMPCIRGMHQKLEQVFINLINNARYALNQKYPQTDPDKRLTISATPLPGGELAEIVVHDRGTGIPAHLVNRITNPFFSTKPQGEGTGLGLSICHGIIQDHGGSMKFDSVEGEFTRVIIRLPVAKNETT